MQLEPMASASPDGDVQLHPDFLPSFFTDEYGCRVGHHCEYCGDPTCGIDSYYEELRLDQIEKHRDYAVDLEKLRWKRLQESIGDPLPMEHVPTVVSSRQAVIAELGELARRNNRGSSLESRSHELHKSRLRLVRRGR